MEARGIEIPTGKTHPLLKLGRELWDLFFFYLSIFLATVFFSGIVFFIYAGFKSNNLFLIVLYIFSVVFGFILGGRIFNVIRRVLYVLPESSPVIKIVSLIATLIFPTLLIMIGSTNKVFLFMCLLYLLGAILGILLHWSTTRRSFLYWRLEVQTQQSREKDAKGNVL